MPMITYLYRDTTRIHTHAHTCSHMPHHIDRFAITINRHVYSTYSHKQIYVLLKNPVLYHMFSSSHTVDMTSRYVVCLFVLLR